MRPIDFFRSGQLMAHFEGLPTPNYGPKNFWPRTPWAEIWSFSFFQPQNRGKSIFEPADHILFGAKFLFYGKMCVSVSSWVWKKFFEIGQKLAILGQISAILKPSLKGH